MKNSSNSINKAIEPLSQLQLRDLPLEILDYIASFLKFPFAESDEDFESRLRIHKVSNNVKTPAGNICRPGFYIKDKSQKLYRLSNLGSKEEIPLHAFSLNNKYLIAVELGTTLNADLPPQEVPASFIEIADINNKKIILKDYCYNHCKNLCAMANNGCYFAVNAGHCIVFFKIIRKYIFSKGYSWKEIILPSNTTLSAVDFNKQCTKLGYIIGKENEEKKFVTYKIESNPFRKTLDEYLRQKGICKKFTSQLSGEETKKAKSALKNYNRILANFY